MVKNEGYEDRFIFASYAALRLAKIQPFVKRI
jgi:hypothetical protein